MPGARRTEIAGVLGDRLKVRVAAPAEGGKANRAVVELLAERLGLAVRDLEVVSGHSSRDKTVRLGVSADDVEKKLSLMANGRWLFQA